MNLENPISRFKSVVVYRMFPLLIWVLFLHYSQPNNDVKFNISSISGVILSTLTLLWLISIIRFYLHLEKLKDTDFSEIGKDVIDEHISRHRNLSLIFGLLSLIIMMITSYFINKDSLINVYSIHVTQLILFSFGTIQALKCYKFAISVHMPANNSELMKYHHRSHPPINLLNLILGLVSVSPLLISGYKVCNELSSKFPIEHGGIVLFIIYLWVFLKDFSHDVILALDSLLRLKISTKN